MTNESLPTIDSRRNADARLRCPDCGNTDLFIEIMEFESHLVDGNLRYVRLLDAVTSRYICTECSESIEPDWLRQERPYE